MDYNHPSLNDNGDEVDDLSRSEQESESRSAAAADDESEAAGLAVNKDDSAAKAAEYTCNCTEDSLADHNCDSSMTGYNYDSCTAEHCCPAQAAEATVEYEDTMLNSSCVEEAAAETTEAMKMLAVNVGPAADGDDEINQEVIQPACPEVLNSPLMSPLNSSRVVQRGVGQSWGPSRDESSPDTSFSVNAVTDTNWQTNYRTVKERNEIMINNELMADVHFLVGMGSSIRRIAGHKYQLCVGSAVFYAMFYGPMASTVKQGDIEVPDVEPGAFVNLLRYLYSDVVTLDPDSVLSTLYAAKKYLVPHLASECVRYLGTRLTADNACILLAQARLFEEEDLMKRCWEVIDVQAVSALRSEGFAQVDRATFESILARDTLNTPEVVVFEAAAVWTIAECARQQLEPSSTNKRAVLGNSLYLIRISSISVEDFADIVVPAGVLTDAETVDVFVFHTSRFPSRQSLRFNPQPRAGLSQRICRRFRSASYRSNQWRYRGRTDAIQVCVSRRVFLAGVGVYGSSNGAAMYDACVEVQRMGSSETMIRLITTITSDGSSAVFPIVFPEVVVLEGGIQHTVTIQMRGPELSYFGQEGMAEVNVGDVLFSFSPSTESTNGTGVQGGQIPELIFY